MGGACYVNGTFTLSAYSAGAHHYRFCRSNDTTGWGGCGYVMTWSSGSTFTVSGSNLPSNGYRRAYYVSACDSANNCTPWSSNTPAYVRMDTSGPTAPGSTVVVCAYASGGVCWVTGNFQVNVSPASDSGSGVDSYQVCRSQDTTSWGGCNVSLSTSAGTSYTVSGSHLPSDGYQRAYYFRAKDRLGNWSLWNDEGYVRVDRYAPTISANNSSTQWFSSRTATIAAADATGGAGSNSGLAAVRYRWNAGLDSACANGTATSAGATLAAPEGNNTLYLCARDRTGRTSYWSGIYRVDGNPPTQPGPTTFNCAYTAGSDCWVTGAFVASAAPSIDSGTGVTGYRFCRSNDTTGWGGCAADVVPIGSAGTSVTVSGSHLPSDGYRRAYYFQAVDGSGNWSLWNDEGYVRVDRYAPTVSANNSSTQWFSSRTATISAADVTGGAGSNSGLAAVRYRWNVPLNSACTNGTATSAGATLTVPEGDNTLYLCARDRTGRTSYWNGIYRADGNPPTQPGPTTFNCAYTAGSDCWVTGAVVASAAPSIDSGTGVTGYRFCRSNDTTGWGGCAVDVVPIGSAGTSVTVSGSHLPSDGYRRAYYFQAVDGNGNWSLWNDEGYVRVDRYAPTVSANNSSTQWFSSRTATIAAADATGGAGSNSGLAAVRYRWNALLNSACTNGTATSAGATLTVPEGDNTLYLCARDRTGRTASWTGIYRVDGGPPSAPGPTTFNCTNTSGSECWVTGTFVASAAPSTDGGAGVTGYRFCRSNDTTGWGGCAVDVVPIGSAGTSVTVSGSHLPSDGYTRAYYFQAVDANGNWSPWNDEGYVRVDRYDPTVSATNASSQWFSSRTATISAADTTGGAGSNSGLVEIRYRWNAALNGTCTNGTVTTAGATLSAPEGDNILHLCARDVAGRIGRWSGTYRVDVSRPDIDSLTISSNAWSIGDGSTYQITARASDAGSGIRELRALINLQGDNSANPRGNLSWRDQSLGYLWSEDRVPCAGGGWASQRPDAFNPETVTLVGCSTSLSGGQRTVVFTVRPEASFGEFGPINDISFWTRDFLLNARGWQNFDLNFSSGVRPPAAIQVRNDVGSALAHNATVSWGTAELGSGGGQIAKTFTVKNVAPAGSANLLLEHSPSNLEIVGSSAFSIGGTLASPLAVGQQDAFTVRLGTSQPGPHSAVLKIWHDDPNRPIPLRINLSADVIAAPVISSVSPSKTTPGGSRTVVITGSNFFGATVSIATGKNEPDDPDRVFPVVTGQSVSSDGKRITATLDTSGADGIYNLVVETSCEDCFDARDFRVAPSSQPVIDMYTPSEVSAGRIFPMVLTGVNLQNSVVTTSHPEIMVLDVDSSDDEMISGILAVPVGIDPRNASIRIQRPNGAFLEVPVTSVSAGTGTKKNYPVVSQETREKARAEGVELPALYIQEPTLSPQMMERIRTGELTDEKLHSCLFSFTRRLFSFTRVYVLTIDEIGQVDPRVLQALGLGQLTRFGTITISFFADITLQFSFDFCRFTDFQLCIFGTIGAEIVGFEGIIQNFTFCLPFGGNSNTTSTNGGSLSEARMSSDGRCTTVTQITEPLGGGIAFANGSRGAHYGEVRLDACCAEPVKLDVRLSTFTGVPFFALNNIEGQVEIPTTTEANCCACTATLDNKELKPTSGTGAGLFSETPLSGSIRNDSTETCTYTVELSKKSGSPDTQFTPQSVNVEIPAGQTVNLSSLNAVVKLPEGTPAGDSATMEVTAISGDTSCKAEATGCPVPGNEVSLFEFWQPTGTVALFNGLLLPKNEAHFATREVEESLSGFFDQCHYTGSPIPPASPANIIADGDWVVFDIAPDLLNFYGSDIIGIQNADLEDVYGPRLSEGGSCQMGWTQTMSMSCPAPLGMRAYKNNPVRISLIKLGGDTKVEVCRHKDGNSVPGEFGCSDLR